MALTDQLISFWELEEPSGSRADSHGSNTLVDNNTVTQQTGKVGNCGQFTRVNSEYLSIADNVALSSGNIDFTLMAWVYADSFGVTAPMIAGKGTGNGVDAHDEYLLYYNTGLARFRFLTASGTGPVSVQSANTLGAPSTGTWYLLIGWHDAAADTVNIQANNGTVDSVSYNQGGNPSGTDPFRIGWDGVYDYWNGRIDQVGFWKRVLTAGERTQLYNSGNGLSYAAMLSSLPPQPRIISQAVQRAASW